MSARSDAIAACIASRSASCVSSSTTRSSRPARTESRAAANAGLRAALASRSSAGDDFRRAPACIARTGDASLLLVPSSPSSVTPTPSDESVGARS